MIVVTFAKTVIIVRDYSSVIIA